MLNKKGIALAALVETLRELDYPVMPGGVEAGGNVYERSGVIL